MTRDYTQPTDLNEYNRQFKRNYRLEGYGIEGLVYHWPCPFCGCPDWKVHKFFELGKMAEPSLCPHCGRTSRHDVEHDHDATIGRLVFVDGPEPEPWFPRQAYWTEEELAASREQP